MASLRRASHLVRPLLRLRPVSSPHHQPAPPRPSLSSLLSTSQHIRTRPSLPLLSHRFPNKSTLSQSDLSASPFSFNRATLRFLSTADDATSGGSKRSHVVASAAEVTSVADVAVPAEAAGAGGDLRDQDVRLARLAASEEGAIWGADAVGEADDDVESAAGSDESEDADKEDEDDEENPLAVMGAGMGGAEQWKTASRGLATGSVATSDSSAADDDADFDLEGAGDLLQMGDRLHGMPRRVQRFMIQKMLKVKPEEPPSMSRLKKQFKMRIIDVNRTAKVTKGGKVLSFTALVVCGNGDGTAGYGKGKAEEMGPAVEKAYLRALRNLHFFSRHRGRTVAEPMLSKFGKTQVQLWPARKGQGMSAGGTLAGILRLAGFQAVKTKVIGSRHPHNTVKATFQALSMLTERSEASQQAQQQAMVQA